MKIIQVNKNPPDSSDLEVSSDPDSSCAFVDGEG